MSAGNAVVFGAGGGIGSALTKALVASKNYDQVFAVSRTPQNIAGATPLTTEVTSEECLKETAATLTQHGPLSLSITSIGVLSDEAGLRPEKTYKEQELDNFEQVFKINTFAPALIAKHMLPLMPTTAPGIFAVLSARVGSISDNRLGGWHAYRASKSALNMLIKNYAIEQARRNKEFVAVGLHPGTVDTALSRPFQKNVPEDRLFSADQSAQYLLTVLSGLTPEDSGKIFDWGGNEIAP